MLRICISAVYVGMLYFVYVSASENANGKYEVELQNVTKCKTPQPPYSNTSVVVLKFRILKVKGRSILSGISTVLSEVPFRNFSIRTYNMPVNDTPVLQFANLSCRQFVSKSFLILAGFKYSKNNCLLQKGTFEYRDLDLNKIAHSFPSWHSKGTLMHEIMLVSRENTIFCMNVVVVVKYL